MCAKVVQAEWRTKRKTQFFIFYPEAKPILGKVPKVEIPFHCSKYLGQSALICDPWVFRSFFGMIFVILSKFDVSL
jgi:hypothetical protein